MPIPLVALGPYTFTSGYNPKKIDGPKRTTHVIEHEIPGREGGVIEYVGSKQPTYRIQGFLAPLLDAFNGVVGANLSGTSYLALTADSAVQYLLGLRGSGALLLRIESTWTQFSGYSVMYENDFFFITSITIAQEAGRGYPYYPYGIDLMRASYNTYGNSSGATVFNGVGGNDFFSGYIYASQWTSGVGFPQGGVVFGLGIQIRTITSGSDMKMAIYTSGGVTLKAQSASQTVISGWNYFPLQPNFQTTSGTGYVLAVKSDAATNLWLTPWMLDVAANSGMMTVVSGIAYSADFPASLTLFGAGFVSGINLNMVIVTG